MEPAFAYICKTLGNQFVVGRQVRNPVVVLVGPHIGFPMCASRCRTCSTRIRLCHLGTGNDCTGVGMHKGIRMDNKQKTDLRAVINKIVRAIEA